MESLADDPGTPEVPSLLTLARESDQTLRQSTDDEAPPQQQLLPSDNVDADDDDARSQHSDSWEVVTHSHATELIPPPPPPQEEVDEGDEATAATEITLPSPAESHPPSRAASGGTTDTYVYTISADEIHSDAETHRTDDLLRQGDVDFPIGGGALLPTATDAAAAATAAAAANAGEEEEEEEEGEHQQQRETATLSEQNTEEESYDDDDDIDFSSLPEATAAFLLSAVHSAGTNASNLVATLADRLRAFARRVRAYVAHHQPLVAAEAQRMVGAMAGTVQELARSLQVCVAPGVHALYIPLSGATVVASDVVEVMQHAVCQAVCRARKGVSQFSAEFSVKDVDWVKVGLMLGCAGMLGMLWKVNSANVRLAGRLAQREGELAELVARIVALQRNITFQRIPIIRHTRTTSLVAGSWSSLVQAI